MLRHDCLADKLLHLASCVRHALRLRDDPEPEQFDERFLRLAKEIRELDRKETSCTTGTN